MKRHGKNMKKIPKGTKPKEPSQKKLDNLSRSINSIKGANRYLRLENDEMVQSLKVLTKYVRSIIGYERNLQTAASFGGTTFSDCEAAEALIAKAELREA